MDNDLLKKTKSKKTRGLLVAVVLVAFAVVFFVGFNVLGPGANGEKKDPEKCGTSDGIVTVTIECKELADDPEKLEKPELKKYIPEDGVILDAKEYPFQQGESVYDALEAVCMEEKIHLETSEDKMYKSRYVEGINYLYEKDGGKNSGWMYTVNGDSPNYGASKVKLKDKQKIVWYYTVDYEKE